MRIDVRISFGSSADVIASRKKSSDAISRVPPGPWATIVPPSASTADG
jgi:hypothetical protein